MRQKTGQGRREKRVNEEGSERNRKKNYASQLESNIRGPILPFSLFAMPIQ